MDKHTLQARFGTQEEAESAVRKLASLRADRFRVERETGGYARRVAPDPDAGRTPGAMAASVPVGAPVENYSAFQSSEFASDLGGAPAAAFTLSADVPMAVAEQARKVIVDAGGRLV